MDGLIVLDRVPSSSGRSCSRTSSAGRARSAPTARGSCSSAMFDLANEDVRLGCTRAWSRFLTSACCGSKPSGHSADDSARDAARDTALDSASTPASVFGVGMWRRNRSWRVRSSSAPLHPAPPHAARSSPAEPRAAGATRRRLIPDVGADQVRHRPRRADLRVERFPDLIAHERDQDHEQGEQAHDPPDAREPAKPPSGCDRGERGRTEQAQPDEEGRARLVVQEDRRPAARSHPRRGRRGGPSPGPRSRTKKNPSRWSSGPSTLAGPGRRPWPRASDHPGGRWRRGPERLDVRGPAHGAQQDRRAARASPLRG